MQRPASYRWQKVVLGAGVVHAMRGGQHPWTDRSSSSSPAKAGDSEKIMLTNASSLVAAEPSKTIADNGASRHGANSGQHALHHAECNKPADFGRKRTSERRQCEKPAGRRGLRVCAQMRQTRGRAPSYPNANMRFMFDYLHGKINKRFSTAAGGGISGTTPASRWAAGSMPSSCALRSRSEPAERRRAAECGASIRACKRR